MHKIHKAQSGNVLWVILMAVVLLGLLTMVLSRSGSQVDQTANTEQLTIKSAQILRYAKTLEDAVQKLKLDGISEKALSFQNTTTATDYTNANCTTTACRIFDGGGAGLAYRNFDGANNGEDWIFTGANNVGTTANPVGTTAGGSGNDLVMLLPNVGSALCIQINREWGIGTAGTLPEDTTGVSTTAFTGTYTAGAAVVLEGDPAPFELNGKHAGCFTDTAADPDIVYFYYVILAR